jgi:predicted transcriptional regulator
MSRWNMRRSQMDIIVEILEVARADANKTSIVYRTNLNFKLAEKYLNLLQKNGLMDSRLDKYKITEKGKSYLEKAKEVTLQL